MVSHFNYISTLRENCSENCEQEQCGDIDGGGDNCCYDLQVCTACAESNSGWRGAIVTISGVPSDGVDCHWDGSAWTHQMQCDQINGTFPMCGLFVVPTGELNSVVWCRLVESTSFPAGYIACAEEVGSPWPLNVFAGVVCSGDPAIPGSQYRTIYVQVDSGFGYTVGMWAVSEPIDGPHPLWDDLCDGLAVELPAVGFEQICYWSSGTATIQLTCDDTDCTTIVPADTCENMANCLEAIDVSMAIWVNGFITHSLSGTDDIGIFTGSFPYDNLNGSYQLRRALVTDPLGGGYTGNDPWWFYGELGTLADYSDPGILIGSKDYSTDPYKSDWQREWYIYGVYLKFSCSLSETVIDEVIFLGQYFWGGTPGTYPYIWPTYERITYGIYNSPIATHSGRAHGCLTTDMENSYTDDFDSGALTFSNDFIIQSFTGPIT